MSSVLCKLGWHDWGKFGSMIKAYGGLTQFRECNRCGRISYAETYGNQASSEQVNDSLKEVDNED